MAVTYRFGQFELDTTEHRLLRDGVAIPLQPKAFDVLAYVVARPGHLLTKDQLLDAVWSGTHVTENSLTRCMGLIRHVLDDHADAPHYLETVPRVGYRFIGDVTVETTGDDADDRLLEIDEVRRAAYFRRWRTGALLATGMVLLITLFWEQWLPFIVPGPVSDIPENSIGVLPFENMSPDPEQEYFSDGISEELLHLLSKIPGLRVAARTSSFQFKGQHDDIAKIADALNVALVLEGSVRKSGNNLRISAQLINADDGFHLWSGSYDRELEDIFAVQDEISASIVAALQERLGLQADEALRSSATSNTEAHDAYLRGRYLVVQRTQRTVEGAVREFEKAIALDPDYALAHAELALATLLLGDYAGLTDTEVVARAAPHAEQAMALAPTLAEAHAAAGFLSWGQANPEEALPHFRHAIQINPNYSIVYLWMGALLYSDLGRYDQAWVATEMAMRLDPLSRPTIGNYISGLFARNRLDEAERELDKIASISPDLYVLGRGYLAARGGKWGIGTLSVLDALRMTPEQVSLRNNLSVLFALIGLEKEALAVSGQPSPFVLTRLGKPADAAVAAEARAAEEPISRLARHDMGLALAGAGDYARARPLLEEMWQWSGGRVICCGYYFGPHSAAALIAVRRNAGEEAGVGELVAAIRDDVRRLHEAGINRSWGYDSVDYEEGLAAYLAGERERGLSLIAKAAEGGFFIPPSEAYLQTLYDDPGFAPIRASQEARQARERDRFLAIVCADNPYAAVWQPAVGTCENFTAAGGN